MGNIVARMMVVGIFDAFAERLPIEPFALLSIVRRASHPLFQNRQALGGQDGVFFEPRIVTKIEFDDVAPLRHLKRVSGLKKSSRSTSRAAPLNGTTIIR